MLDRVDTDTVTIPRAEYEGLLELKEDMEDAALARDIMDKVKRGEMETYPAEFIRRLHCGDEHPLKVWRDYRGLKAKELAEQVGVTPVYISNIERGKQTGSVELLVKIAKVLNVDVDDLIDDREE